MLQAPFLGDVQGTLAWILLTIASVSAFLNVLFIKGIVAELKDLRASHHSHATLLSTLGTDIDWLLGRKKHYKGDEHGRAHE